MVIQNIIHKGLRQLILADDSSGIPTVVAEKIRCMVSFLQDMNDIEEIKAIPSWKAHQLIGQRYGTWSLTVTKNWRLTFKVDHSNQHILDLNYEDYH
jgi:proteic killer suppression protein